MWGIALERRSHHKLEREFLWNANSNKNSKKYAGEVLTAL